LSRRDFVVLNYAVLNVIILKQFLTLSPNMRNLNLVWDL
jgi:hypothetical protein